MAICLAHEERENRALDTGLSGAGKTTLARGDERKAIIGLAVKRETTVPMDWIASRLQMGTRSTVSREAEAMWRRLSHERKLQKRYQSIMENAV